MVVGLDLKPLTEETITEMGYNSHDLWLVKIGLITFGPYETESLKHYVGDNEHLFEDAQASRMDNIQWTPFWENTVFQRRKIQAVNGEQHEGPFWLMDMGLKIGPLSFRDIDKKIEMGLLVMTDHISIDEGHSWKKIYEIEGFDRRTYSPDELPIAPLESSFQKAKLALVDKMEQPHIHVSEELADMAYSGQQQAKVIQFKVDEMTLQAPKSAEMSDSIRWAMPAAAAVVMALMTTGYFMFSSDDDGLVAEDAKEKQFYQPGADGNKTAKGFVPNENARRSPASVGYGHTPQNDYSQSRYPTHMDMHENYDEPVMDRDPIDGPVTDVEQIPPEQSLVGNDNNGNGESLDAAMNGINQPIEQPIVDEASDF
jgi:hypothetical protein